MEFCELCATVADELAANSGRSLICTGCRVVLLPGGKKLKLAMEATKTDSQPNPPQLPTEIWTQIFEKLSAWQLWRVRLICRRWRDIVDASPSLVANFKVCFAAPLIIDRGYRPDHLLRAPKVCFDRVRIFAIGSWWAPFGQALTDIELDDCKIMLPNLLAILRHTTNLRCLQLKNAVVDMLGNNPQADFRLEKLKKLVVLGIHRAENLQVLGEICPNVKHLTLLNNGHDLPARNFDGCKVAFVSVRHSTLEHLEIDCDDLILIELIKFKHWNLKGLVLGGYGNVVKIENVALLIDFCRILPSLETLRVEGALSIVTAFNEIQQLLPKLKTLMLMPEETLQIQPTILTQIANLQDLQLSGSSSDCLPVDFTGIECPQLKSLILDKLSISNRSLEQFLASAANLSHLVLFYCQFSSWPNILRAIGVCKRLQTLSIQNMSAIECNRCIIEYLDDMRHLKLVDCRIPQEMLSTLLCLCPRLQVLHLALLKEVCADGEVLRVLCEKLHNLVRVKIEQCELSPQATSYFRQNCTVLETLEIV